MLAIKKIKSLGRNLPRNVENLWSEYFKVLARGAEVVDGGAAASKGPSPEADL